MEKAASHLPTSSGALGPVIVMTMVGAVLPAREVSVVSHLGWAVKANPKLKVVSSVAIAASEYEVGILCTRKWDTGESK